MLCFLLPPSYTVYRFLVPISDDSNMTLSYRVGVEYGNVMRVFMLPSNEAGLFLFIMYMALAAC